MWSYEDFYLAFGSSMSLVLLVLGSGGMLKRVLHFFGEKSSWGEISLSCTCLKNNKLVINEDKND